MCSNCLRPVNLQVHLLTNLIGSCRYCTNRRLVTRVILYYPNVGSAPAPHFAAKEAIPRVYRVYAKTKSNKGANPTRPDQGRNIATIATSPHGLAPTGTRLHYTSRPSKAHHRLVQTNLGRV